MIKSVTLMLKAWDLTGMLYIREIYSESASHTATACTVTKWEHTVQVNSASPVTAVVT